MPMAPDVHVLDTLAALATWAGLAPSDEIMSAAAAELEPLAAMLLSKGRPALLSKLKELGIARLAERQALAGALQRAIREGLLRRHGDHVFPLDFQIALDRWPEAVRRAVLEPEVDLPPIEALLDALRRAGEANKAADPMTNPLPAAPAAMAGCLLTQPRAIGPEGCAALRRAVDGSRSVARDSVDKAAEHQLNMAPEDLERLIGPEDYATLIALPARLLAAEDATGCAWSGSVASGAGGGASGLDARGFRLEVFVRRYARGERPWIPFHCDNARVTVNVALADDARHEGGRLIAAAEGALRRLERAEGEATCHSGRMDVALAAAA